VIVASDKQHMLKGKQITATNLNDSMVIMGGVTNSHKKENPSGP